MKTLLLSTVAFAGLAASALAADLPSRRAPVAMAAPVPVFTWTGFYVGVNAGWAWNDDRVGDSHFFAPGSIVGSEDTTGTITFVSPRDNDGSLIGGGQIGYNWQMGGFVVGVEADIQAADLNGVNRGAETYAFSGTPGFAFGLPAPTVVRSNSGIDWFGTVRARAGVAFDRLLVFATGGFAYGGGDEDNCFAFAGCSGDDTRTGYAVGGGLEYAFTNNWTFKIEGLYVNLDRDKGFTAFDLATNPPGGTVVLRTGDDDGFGVVRGGVNFKF